MEETSEQSAIRASGESASATSKSISSPGLEDSRSASAGPECRQISLFSPEGRPVSHFQKLANDKALQMLATSGQKCSALYGCSGLGTSSSRTFLDLLLGGAGLFLTRWSPIWSPRVTRLSRRLWFRLRVSAHGTEETGFGFWPTATTVPDAPNTNSNQVNEFTSLGAAMRLIPTVRANKWGLPDSHGSTEAWGFLPTARASDSKNNPYQRDRGEVGKERPTLSGWARMMPTPTAVTDAGGAAMCKWGGARSRETIKEILGTTELNGALNPEWVEWFMGYPQGWTDFQGWATQSSRCLAVGSEK